MSSQFTNTQKHKTMKKVNLELSEQEVNLLLECLDIAVKNVGLKGSYAISLLAINISNQVKEGLKEQENVTE